MIYDCILAGAGASGLFFAASAPRRTKGIILEKTGRAGTKLLMSGSGQCNITHSGPIKDFIPKYCENGPAVRRCLYRYSNSSLVDFLRSGGIATVARDDGKIFPLSMEAEDIRSFLMERSAQNGFTFKYDTPLTAISSDPCGWKVLSGSRSFLTKSLVLAAGGCSYPSTGSDGNLFSVLARDLELEIVPPAPALCPVIPESYPYGELTGISFENVRITVFRRGKKISENTGDLLFTESNLSGPAVLDISRNIMPGDTVMINYLFPAGFEEVFARLKSADHGSKKEFASLIRGTTNLPARFCRSIAQRYGPSLKKAAACLTGETFTVKELSGFRKAMVTRGGVSLSEIDTSSMELRRFPGIFVIGEMCDVDGATGGYNLQFAYSSARAAAESLFFCSTCAMML